MSKQTRFPSLRCLVPLLALAAVPAFAVTPPTDDVPPAGIDAAQWRAIQQQIAEQVDAQLVAGPTPVANRGLADIHGLVRTHTVSGSYTDLPPQDAEFGPEFGHSVALRGDWLAVGAPGTVSADDEYGAADHGATFVFRRVGGAWNLHQRLIRVTGYGGERCGYSVAMSGTHLAVGCPERQHQAGDPSTGAVQIWRYDATSEQFVFHVLQNVTSSPVWMRCGFSVALTADYLAVGCPSADNDRGQVRLRKRSTEGNWGGPGTLEQVLYGEDVDALSFGASLALYQPGVVGIGPLNVRLAVGAPNSVYAGSAFPRGSVHMYHRALDAPQWNPSTVMRLSPLGSDGHELGQFGAALAMNRNQLIAGAPNNRAHSGQQLPGSGTVRRYELSSVLGLGWLAQESSGATNVPDGPAQRMRYGAAIAILHDNLIAVSAPATDGRFNNDDVAEEVGLVEPRRTANGDWSVAHYHGELRPAPLSSIARPGGRFGTALASDTINHRLAVGYPRSGTTLVLPGQPNRPRGSVWIYDTDELFANGFQCSTGLPGC